MTNVYGTIQIVAAALHVSKMGHLKMIYIFIGQLCQPFIRRTHIYQLRADGRCGQMSVEYDQVRLAATGI